MNGKAGALAYLLIRTTRNRIVKQALRVRNPRYAFALLFGLGYLYLTFLRPGALPRSGGGSIPNAMSGAVVSVLLLFTVVVTWLFTRNSVALAFLPAEVQFLFAGPLSRRQLLGYRMVRSQLVLLLNAIIWTVVLRRFGVLVPAPIRFATAWALFSVMSLHALGAALVLARPARGTRLLVGFAARALAVLAVVTVVVGTAPALQQLGDGGFSAGFEALGRAVTAPPIATVLAPFRLLVAPILAPTTAAWFSAFAVVLTIIALHIVWVLAMQVEFTDVAVAASAKRATRIAAMKAARSGDAITPKAGKAARHWLPLSPVGPPGLAIAWKNTVALFRGGGVRTVVIIVLIGFMIVMSRSIGSGGRTESSPAAALPFLMLVSMTLLMGPRLLRNDLRQDLLRLGTLKTYPLKGRTMVAAETLSPTVVLTAFQLLMLAIGGATISGATQAVGGRGMALVLIVVLPFVLLALNGINVVIQNGIALLFPSWVRLGSDSGGIEAMGQNLLVTFGSMFALMLALLFPVGAAVALVAFVQFTAGEAAMAGAAAAGGIVAVLLLGGEIVALVNIFGRSFERIDPTAIG